MKLSVGVDLHKTQFTVCMLSEDREVTAYSKHLTNKKGYEAFTDRLKAYETEGYKVAVAVESTGNTRFFRNQIVGKGFDVKIVNTAKFKVVTQSVKKTDHHDANTLAEFLEKDMLPEAQLCSEDSERIRRVIKSRSILVKALISLKNQVHGFLLSYGIESKRGQLQSKKERQRILRGLEDHRSFGNAALAVKPLLDTIDKLYEEVKKLEKLLQELVSEDEDVKLLHTIPGVGLITAATIRAFTDDINRFKSSKKYAAHSGLVPWVQNSNMTIHHGHITKRGPQELRTAFVQVVMGMIRFKRVTGAYRIMNRYYAMKKYKGSGKAIIAAARKVSKFVWAMLKNKRPFDPLKMLNMKEYRNMQTAACYAAMAG
jgi:transposase